MNMSKPLAPKWVVIGAPSSAGAYAPGQEKAPQALRAAGLLDSLKARRITIEDWGDVPGFRWRADHSDPRAMNVMMATTVARATAARRVAEGWAQRFERLLVHVDVDVLDFLDLPLAENVRRNRGLRFDQLIMALGPLLSQPNLAALTVTEVNPDHGEEDGTTLRHFNEALAETLSAHRP